MTLANMSDINRATTTKKENSTKSVSLVTHAIHIISTVVHCSFVRLTEVVFCLLVSISFSQHKHTHSLAPDFLYVQAQIDNGFVMSFLYVFYLNEITFRTIYNCFMEHRNYYHSFFLVLLSHFLNLVLLTIYLAFISSDLDDDA